MGAKASRERISQEVEAQLLRKEIESLKRDNDHIREMLKRELRTPQVRLPQPNSTVSLEVVDEIVEEMLSDPNSNLPFVPDFVERQMLQKAVLYMLSALAKAVDSSNVETMGHEVVMSMRPVQKKKAKKPISCSTSESGSGSLTREIRNSFEETTLKI